MKHYIVQVEGGLVTVYFTEEGIYRLVLAASKDLSLDPRIESREDFLSWPSLEKELKEYFLGKEIRGSYPLLTEGYSPWTLKVLQLAAIIPYGQVLTYGQLAERAGSPKGARAVGQALSRNRTPILIPCHRIVGKDGRLGGFSSGLGWKERLLRLERGELDALSIGR